MKTIFILFIAILSYQIQAQIRVGTVSKDVGVLNEKMNETELTCLKNSTTIFIYRNIDRENLALFKSTLSSVWTITKLEFVSYDEFIKNKYEGNYSFFTIGGNDVTRQSSSGLVSSNTYFYLMLWMNIKQEQASFCRIELYPTFEAYKKANENIEDNMPKMMKYLYEDAKFYNWNLGYLKNALQFVNNNLSKSETTWSGIKCVSLSPLKKDTLYIPDYTLISFNKWNGDESKRHDITDLFKKYSFPYKVVPVNVLTSMILNLVQPIYYLSYIKSSTQEFINVINSKTGEILYVDYSPISYNISSKDIGSLAKAISKSK